MSKPSKRQAARLAADPSARPTGRGSGKKRGPSGGGKGSGAAPGKSRRTAATGRGRGRRAADGATGRRRSLVGRLLVWGLAAAVWGVIALTGLLAWWASDLPDLADARPLIRQPSVVLLDASGRPFARFGQTYGGAVTLDQVSPHVVPALLAAEDRRFADHRGIDPRALVRATVANVRAGRVTQGGSTLTQQLAKNLFLTPERTFRRKAQEAMLALWLERRFSKAEILTLYLNRVYFGAGAYGIAAAAERFFDKPPAELTLYESAMLVGVLTAPSRLNPANNPDGAARGARRVLDDLVDWRRLTPEQRAQALATAPSAPTARAGNARTLAGGAGADRVPRQARYFADWVVDSLTDYVGPSERDLVVETSLDPALQALGESVVAAVMARDGAGRGVAQAALVAMRPSGQVVAMIGGLDYGQSQFNRAVQARRQPGSAFKPVVFLAALEAGLTPDSQVLDAPIVLGDWHPGNFDDTYLGVVSLRTAAARSLNSVAVRLVQQVGAARVVAAARRLGVLSPLQPLPSLALGTEEVTLLELTSAYAVFASGGQAVRPFGIRTVAVSGGGAGAEPFDIFRRQLSPAPAVVRPRDIGHMHELLGAVMGDGTGRQAAIGRPAAGKTGTSQDQRDGWFIGYTADLVVGVWVGNDDSSPTGGPAGAVTGGNLPAIIWHDFMLAAHNGLPVRPLTMPAPVTGGGLFGGGASTGAGSGGGRGTE
ncbi:MAG: PBP1A family penicillin-binding protein [Alphaproteobacteria bacterium]